MLLLCTSAVGAAQLICLPGAFVQAEYENGQQLTRQVTAYVESLAQAIVKV